MIPVPEDDLPDSLKGTAVPESDLPDAAPAPKPAENMARATGIKPLAGPVSPRSGKPVSALRGAMEQQPIAMQDMGDAARGTAEFLGKGLIDTVGSAIGGTAGLLGAAGKTAIDLVQGSELGAAIDAGANTGADAVNSVQGAAGKISGMIPQNQQAQNIAHNVGGVMQDFRTKMGKGGAYAGEALIGPEAKEPMRAMGEAYADMAPTILGAPSAIRAGRQMASTPKPRMDQTPSALTQMKSNGYAVPPQAINPTMLNKVAATVANPDELLAEIQRKNAKVDERHAKADIGLEERQFLNRRNVANKKAKAGIAYDNLRKLDDVQLTVDDELRRAVMESDKASQGLRERFPDFYRNNNLENIKSESLSTHASLGVGDLLEHVQNLRNDAKTLFRKADAGPLERKQAYAMRNIATAMEDWLERKVTEEYYVGGEATAVPTPGNAVVRMGEAPTPTKQGVLTKVDNAKRQKLIDDWRKARVMLAKIDNIEEAANLDTGQVNPAIVSRIAKEGGKLTGGLEKIRQAYDSTKDLDSSHLRASDSAVGNAVAKAVRGVGGVLASGSAGAGAGAAVGGPVGAAIGGAGGVVLPFATRKLMAGLLNKYMSSPSPSLLEQIRQIDPKTAAKLTAAQAGQTNTKLPEPQK